MANVNNAKYKKEYIEKVDEYLEENKDTNVRISRRGIRKTGEYKDSPYVIYDTKFKVKLPTIYGFALYVGVSEKTVGNWGKVHKKFRRALDKIKNEQKQRLVNMGLSGDYNSTIAKFILSSNHGMKERKDLTSDDEPINSFNDEQIDRIADRIARRKNDDGGTSSAEESN